MTDLKPCPSRPYGDDPRVQALVDALRVVAGLALISTDPLMRHAVSAASAALKQWEDGE